MPRPGQRVAEPPLDVGDGGRPERAQPGADQLGAGGFGRCGFGGRGQPVRRGRPPWPRYGPAAVVGPPDDIAAHGQHRQHPGSQRSVSAPTLSGRGIVVAGQFRQCRAQFLGAGRTVLGEVPQHGACRPGPATRRRRPRSPAFCTSATRRRRSLSATRSLAAAWISGKSSARTTHSVRRIARCLTRSRRV